MGARVHEVVQYAAECRECRWEGEVHNDNEDFAIEDADEHNEKHHPKGTK